MIPASSVFVSRHGKLAGYEVWGWRYLEGYVWRVKLWPESGDRQEHAYLVVDGEFESDRVPLEEKLVVLQLLKKWESESRNEPKFVRAAQTESGAKPRQVDPGLL